MSNSFWDRFRISEEIDFSRQALFAGLAMTLSFLLVRAGMVDGVQGLLIAVGLSGVDLACILYLELLAKRHQGRFGAWRKRCEGRLQKVKALADAEKQHGEIYSQRQDKERQRRALVAQIKLRELHNFDLPEMCQVAERALVEGYLTGIDTNRGLTAAGKLEVTAA